MDWGGVRKGKCISIIFLAYFKSNPHDIVFHFTLRVFCTEPRTDWWPTHTFQNFQSISIAALVLKAFFPTCCSAWVSKEFCSTKSFRDTDGWRMLHLGQDASRVLLQVLQQWTPTGGSCMALRVHIWLARLVSWSQPLQEGWESEGCSWVFHEQLMTYHSFSDTVKTEQKFNKGRSNTDIWQQYFVIDDLQNIKYTVPIYFSWTATPNP